MSAAIVLAAARESIPVLAQVTLCLIALSCTALAGALIVFLVRELREEAAKRKGGRRGDATRSDG
jgi:hypothetical protein